MFTFMLILALMVACAETRRHFDKMRTQFEELRSDSNRIGLRVAVLELSGFALSALAREKPDSFLEVRLGRVEPEIAAGVQAQLKRLGHPLLLTLNTRGEHVILRPKPACGPALDCRC